MKKAQEKHYPAFYLTVDIVVMTIRSGQLSVLLVKRRGTPFAGRWALPGGFVGHGEEVEAAARRELAEETGVEKVPEELYLEQLKTYGRVGRDPRGRIVSSAWVALINDLPLPQAGSDAAEARWWPVADLEGEEAPELAFDHQEILRDGLERVQAKLEYTSVAGSFVDEKFTISELRRVYEAVWGQDVDRIGFHERVLKNEGFIVPAGGKAQSASAGGRPALLYKRGKKFWLDYPIRREREA